MRRVLQKTLELMAIAVTLVAGYLYFEELGRRWVFWVLALSVGFIAVGWIGRRRLLRLLRAPR
jgi:uncharacterized membrane protein YfcA